MTHNENADAQWRVIYQIGATAALGAVLVGVLEIAITFLPGGNASQDTVLDWFALFAQNWFLGLRNLGLLNILLNLLAVPAYFALYAAHRATRYQPYAAFAALVAFLGTGIFLATNRALPMLALSQQYAVATTDVQRATLAAAAQALLVVGASHTPGTFLGFFLADLAGVLISFVMLRSQVFGRPAAYAGMLGFGLLVVFEVLVSFVADLNAPALTLAMFGGILSMVWYVLVARQLFQLAKEELSDKSAAQ